MKCSYCGSEEIVNDDIANVLFCTKCGLVIEDMPIDFSEVQEKQTERVINIQKPKYLTIGLLDFKINTAIDSKLRKDFAIYKKVFDEFELTEQREIMEDILKKHTILFKNRKTHGLLKNVIVALVTYETCKRYKYIIKIDEIVKFLKVRTKIYNQYKVKLGFNGYIAEDIFELIEVYSKKMLIPDIIKQKAIVTAINYLKDNNTSGKNLTAIASVCIYLSAVFYQSGITQQEIQKYTGISTTTIRRRVKDIKDYLPLEDINFI